MQVQKIGFPPLRGYISAPKNNSKKEYTNDRNSLNMPFAYQDYNISFGERLFRTPANFYAQPFNKKGMPDSMKEYLNADYEDRQNMPPSQMMKLVFDDINQAKSLEQVKRIYPNEPLFLNLTDTPNRKIRKGLASEIEILHSESVNIPLFKDGNSNFGLYLLKKIYLDGKSLKEINKDLHKDLNNIYAELVDRDLNYSDLSVYGIKFPNAAFWKSFIATREDFPYVYRPRKPFDRNLHGSEKTELSIESIKNGTASLPKSSPRFKVNDSEVSRMTDAFINGHGSKNSTLKHLKRKGFKDDEKTNFLDKYRGEIMSVALEKIHASQEMRDYFESYDNLSKHQREKLESYWRNNPQMRQLQSLAISDTIKLFFEYYGADGNNELFKDLLDYAHNIKPKREEEYAKYLEMHNQNQAMYEELFASDAPDQIESSMQQQQSSKNQISDLEMAKMLEQEAIKNGAEVFLFEDPNGKDSYRFVCNVNEIFEKNLREETKLLPDRFVSKYLNHMLRSPLATDEYKKSIALIAVVPEFAKQQLMQPEDYRKISKEINKEFNEKNSKLEVACEQALAERLFSHLGNKDQYASMICLDISTLLDFANSKLNINSWDVSDKARLETDYNNYVTPITNKSDINKINDILIDYIKNANKDSADPASLDDQIIKLLSENMKLHNKVNKLISKIIRQNKFIERYGGSAKILLKPDSEVPESVKKMKCKFMLEDLLSLQSRDLLPLLSISTYNIEKCISDDYLRSVLIQNAYRYSNS